MRTNYGLQLLGCGARILLGAIIAGLAVTHAHAGGLLGKSENSHLSIQWNASTGDVTLSWNGHGSLKQSSSIEGKFSAVSKKGSGSWVTVRPTGSGMLYQVNDNNSNVYSANIVGYINQQLPPGLSLINNPFYYTNSTVALWWPNAPDGSQVLKYSAANGYEVSTFDSQTGTWSNPNMTVEPGEGFYFRNPSSNTIVVTFVGTIYTGTLYNPIPAGHSMKAPLIPRDGSINSVHQIPGEPGDEIRLYINDLHGGGDFVVSTFDGTLNQWVPDLNLPVGQGFWIYKQHAQDWVTIFSVFP